MARKKLAQRLHAKRRARERLGIQLNRRSYRALVDQIRENRGRFIERQSNRITVWEVEHEGERFIAIYDTKRSTIVTVLPEGTEVEPGLHGRI